MFAGCVITLDLATNTSYREKEILRKSVVDNGGVVSYIVTKKVLNII